MLVTILIGNYNYGKYLRQSIESALSQTYQPIEVIVVDDGSTDDSRDIIDTFGDRIVSIFNPNGGQSTVFNTGVVAAHGEIICMLDSDDYFNPAKIARIVEVYTSDPRIDFVFHAVDKIDGLGKHLGKDPVTSVAQVIGVRGKGRFTSPPNTGTTYRRKLLERIFPIPDIAPMGADNYTKFAVIALTHGLYIPDRLAVLRLHGNNHGSMGMPIARRLNHDAAIALALHRKLPSLDCIERQMAISLARLWIIKPIDNSRDMINEYIVSLQFLRRIRFFGYAMLFYLKRRLVGALE